MRHFFLCIFLLSAGSPAAGSWEKLYAQLGNDNKLADIAVGPAGDTIVGVGTLSDGRGGAGPTAIFLHDSGDFVPAATSTSGMAMLLGVAAIDDETFVATRTAIEIDFPNVNMTATLLRSTTSGRSFLPGPVVEDASFMFLDASGNGLVVVTGSTGAETGTPKVWVSLDRGESLQPHDLPPAGEYVRAGRPSILGPDCVFIPGGDTGEDDEGNPVRTPGAGALWVGGSAGPFELRAQDLPAALMVVDFPTPLLGFVGGSRDETAYLARTTSGGNQFTELTLPEHETYGAPTSVGGIRCFDELRCLAAVGFGSGDQAGPGLPMLTDDGGDSWRYDTTMQTDLSLFEKAAGFLAIDAPSPDVAIFAGEHHLIMRFAPDTAPAPQARAACGSTDDDAGVGQDHTTESDGSSPHDAGTSDGGGPPRTDGGERAVDAAEFLVGDINQGGCGCGSGIGAAGVSPALLLVGGWLPTRGQRRRKREAPPLA